MRKIFFSALFLVTFIVGAPAVIRAAEVSGSVDVPLGNVTPNSPGTQVPLGSASPNVQSGGGTQLFNPLGNNMTLPGLLVSILAFVVRLGTFVVIFMLIYVGFLFVKASGAPAKIEDAKKALLWTIVGALILLGAQAIASGIQATVQSIGNGGSTMGSTLNTSSQLPFGMPGGNAP